MPGTAIPLHDWDRWCRDPRFPTLAGEWLIGCGKHGRVDRALHLPTDTAVELPRSFAAPGLGDGVLIGVGDDAGVVVLDPGGARLLDVPAVRQEGVAPPATDGERAVLLTTDGVSTWPLASPSRRTHAARPMGWYPPALARSAEAGAWVAWVEDAGEDGADVMALDADRQERLLGGGPGEQRHVVADGPWLAWVEEGALVLLDTRDGREERRAVDTGFLSPPSLWEEVLCWEERPAHRTDQDGDGVDIRCSDGLDAAGPGHQTHPARHGPWLLYRDAGELWLRTAAPPPAADAADDDGGDDAP